MTGSPSAAAPLSPSAAAPLSPSSRAPAPPDAPSSPAPPGALWQVPRLDPRERWLAGVAGAMAREVGVDPVVIRLSFVLLTLSGGLGLALYAGAWLWFRQHHARHPGRARPPVPKGRSRRERLLGVVCVVAGGVGLSERAFAGGLEGATAWPVGLAAFGMLLAWSSGKVDWAAPYELARAVGGLALVAAGVIGFIALNFGAAAAPKALLVGTAVLSGVLLVVAPWLWRAASQMSEARLERLRQAERAELAAHLHDSVLQTLSLIQQNAGDRAAIASLARRQERELRQWLFGGRPSERSGDLRAALLALASELEAAHRVPIEVVVVGDTPLDEGHSALLGATREAVVNAARHAGAPRVDVYAELGPEALEVFVRDTGRGFDPAAVEADRRGLSESIVARMRRAGGQALVVSAPGQGTEVSLTLPRRQP